MHPNLAQCYQLLPRVSRTFALNIRILPGELRPAITVAYLLFRYADTLEDKPGLGVEERSHLFDSFLDRLDGADSLEHSELFLSRLLAMTGAAETDLILNGEKIFDVFESLPQITQDIISSHVAETARGMERISRARTTGGVMQLETWKDLDEYCYYVAGTIGIMLTRLFLVHCPRLKEHHHLTALSTSFGRGLQLTNILKGIAVDREEGRVYLPAEALSVHGINARNLLAEESRPAVLSIVQEIVPRALTDLDRAMQYTLLLPRRETRLRLFCLWPLFAAVRTLGVIARGDDTARMGIQPKISRTELYREMSAAAFHVFSNRRLERHYTRVRRDLFPARPPVEVWAP